MRKNYKPVMIYLTVSEAAKLEKLKQYYSSDAVKAGVTHVFRLALAQLYQAAGLEKE